MSIQTVFVVTGGNRGIGLGLVGSLLSRPNTSAIATVRNAEASTQLRGMKLAVATGSNLNTLELDFSVAPGPVQIQEIIRATVPHIDHVDVLINNAANGPPMSTAVETSLDELRRTFETNTYAPLIMFQAFWPLLQSPQSPRSS